MRFSRALSGATEAFDTAEELVSLEKLSYPDPLAENNRRVVNGLRGGAAVLMVASFEDFLGTIFAEAGEAVSNATTGQNFQALPERLQVEAVYATLESAMAGPIGRSTKRHDRLPAVRDAARLISQHQFEPKAISSTGSNPNSQTVKALFSRLGLDDSLSKLDAEFSNRWFKSEAGTYFRDKLDEIVQRRHEVAHTGRALTISTIELDTGLRFLRVAAETVAAVLETQVGDLLLLLGAED